MVRAGALSLLFLLAASWAIAEARRMGHFSAFHTVLQLRGGKSKSSARKRTSTTSSKKKTVSHDDEEDDDDDDDDNDYDEDNNDDDGRSRRKTSVKKSGKTSRGRSRKGGSSRSRGGFDQLIPWGSGKGGSKSKAGGLLAGLVSQSREKLEEITKQGQSAYKDVYRRAKVMRSSAFEGMLLRATWPGNEAVPQDILTEIIKHSIPAFKYGRAGSEDDPYHMTLHKLWTKMCEKDYRTVVKSLYVLHSISRDCSADACQRFAIAMKSLSRVRNPKNPEHKYFDVKPIAEVDVMGEPYSKFIAAYATHVLYRTKNFSGKFEELKDITAETHEAQVVARLKKAQQCITNGLKCILVDKTSMNIVVGHTLKLVAADLREILKICSSKLGPLMGEGAAYGGTKAAEKDILALLKFFQQASEQIQGYLSKTQKACQPLRIKISTELGAESKGMLSGEKLTSRIEELTKLSGGSTLFAASAETVSKSMKGGDNDEDDEDVNGGDAEEDNDPEDGDEEGDMGESDEVDDVDGDADDEEEEEEGEETNDDDVEKDSNDPIDDDDDDTNGDDDDEEEEEEGVYDDDKDNNNDDDEEEETVADEDEDEDS